MRKRREAVKRKIPKSPALPPRRIEALTPTERWYLDCFHVLATHLKRSPSMPEFSIFTKRAVNPCYTALRRIASKGWLDRQGKGNARKFVFPAVSP